MENENIQELINKLLKMPDENSNSEGGELTYPLIERTKFLRDYVIQIDYYDEKQDVKFIFYNNKIDTVKQPEFFTFYNSLKKENKERIKSKIEEYILLNS